ncbi:MarR family winged helix-turn-helix transcriptional regulator [Maribellus maritimus]|uniref:MarR family winged helix-turn-helix transcriptional regulator n=1 Tax=Maribellus maritimus TaxID=2870838 RepID=UPI001EEC2962|nr:MarR family transcriptional regulator [Maribellus maritimus]MCG6187040.1 MarR family transcriptional regulator [Maribellus maritimus]
MMVYEQLKLENQLCFPVYAASRLITREYQPYLDKLGITYPQYLVLMVLWENDGLTVNDISQKLILNTNTITPLLKRMETMGIIVRKRSETDERKVMITLTEKGVAMRDEAAEIPEKLVSALLSINLTLNDLIDLKAKLHVIIDYLSDKEKNGHANISDR